MSEDRSGIFCSHESVALEASIQMSDWLAAKDQGLCCCPTCCLGFQTDTELFVHLRHTAVHKVSDPLRCVYFLWSIILPAYAGLF